MNFREGVNQLEGAFDRDSFAFMLEEGVENGRKAVLGSVGAASRGAKGLSELRKRYDKSSPAVQFAIWVALPLGTYISGAHYGSRYVERNLEKICRYCKSLIS